MAKTQPKFTQLLTQRELDVLALLAKGYTNSEIGAKLHISKHTVKNHVSSIYRKAKISDRTQIALLALAEGIASLE